jgi:hypothetical protein
MKFIIMVWLEFFARARPVRQARSPLHEHDEKPVTSVHEVGGDRVLASMLARSPTVRPFFASPGRTSAAVPVTVPAVSQLFFGLRGSSNRR